MTSQSHNLLKSHDLNVDKYLKKNFSASGQNDESFYSSSQNERQSSLFTWESNSYKLYPKYREELIENFKASSKMSRYDGVVELVDLFPTLIDLAGLPGIPSCPEFSQNIEICTEGCSLASVIINSHGKHLENSPFIIKNISMSKKAAFSQYPRPSLEPSVMPDSDQPRTSETQVMGYSLRTNRFRYTAWLKFSNITYKPDFSHIYAEELYDHKVDPDEDHNACHKRKYRFHKKQFLKQLFYRLSKDTLL